MANHELPPGVDYQKIRGNQESRNFTIDRAIFNGETLRLLREMTRLYPAQGSIFGLLSEELDGRLPVSQGGADDPARGLGYDFHSANGWGFANVFDIIGSFPPTAKQYRLLRHFLFQPDLDVRNNAAEVIDRRLDRYDKSIRSEFEEIIRSDPDYTSRLYRWVIDSRQFARENGINLWSSFLGEIPIKPRIKDPEIPDQMLRTYFGIGKDNYFAPKSAARRAHSERAVRSITNDINIIKKIEELRKQGGLTEEEKQKLLEQFHQSDEDFMSAITDSPFPHISVMLGQLWRLPKKDIIQAVSSVIINPEKFEHALMPLEWHYPEIVGLGILASTFIKDQGAQRVMINTVLQSPKYRDDFKIVTPLARAAYALKIDDILRIILPIVRKYPNAASKPTKRLASSLSYAIARDVGHERIPEPRPQEQPYFGY